jgi:alpha-N-acetylglucosamine transferase
MTINNLSDNSINKLKKNGCDVINVDPISSPYKDSNDVKERWKTTFTKLNIWKLTQFKKIIFIDADCIVLKNIDELFLYPEISAVMECCDHFNSGVMVIKPSLEVFDNMMANLKTLYSYDKSDQGFLNTYFIKNKYQPLKYFYNADQTQLINNPTSFKIEELKVIHYVHDKKPWTMKQYENKVQQEIHKLWWDMKETLQ